MTAGWNGFSRPPGKGALSAEIFGKTEAGFLHRIHRGLLGAIRFSGTTLFLELLYREHDLPEMATLLHTGESFTRLRPGKDFINGTEGGEGEGFVQGNKVTA